MKKILSKLMLLVALLVPCVTQAQSLTEYTVSTDTTTFVSIAATGTSLSFSTQDDGYATTTLPFAFAYGESSFTAGTSIACSANGFIYLGSSSASGTTGSYSSTTYRAINAILQQDGHMGRHSGGAYTYYDSVAGTFTIEYNGLGTYGDPYGYFTYQVVFHTNGNIEFIYDSIDLAATSRTLATYLTDGPEGDRLFLTGAWATPTVATAYAARPTTDLPVSGLRYTFTRPVINCPKPLVVDAVSTSDEMTLFWIAGGTETAWEVVFDSNIYYATDTFYTFSNLEANSLHEAAVRAICGDGDTSNYRFYSGRTACGLISSMPYSNDFENEPVYQSGVTTYANAFPFCWTRINDATGSTNYYPYVSSSSSYVINGSRSMYWYLSTSSDYANNEYAVLPGIDLEQYELSDLTFAFYAKTTATSAPFPEFIVGVMTDNTDTTTFSPIDTVTLTSTPELYVFTFDNYSDTGRYIAIRCPRTTSSRYASLDDVFLTDDWCDAPSDVVASDVTSSSITLSWNGNGGTEFNITFGDTTVTNVTDTFYVFDNLSSNTTYEYSIVTVCSNDNSIAASGSVTTACGDMTTLPYTMGFEASEGVSTGGSTSTNFVSCWHRLNNGSTYFGYPYVSSSSTYAHTGSRGLYWFNSITTGTYGDYQYVVLPAVDTTLFPANTLMLSFWAKASSTSYHPQFQVGVMSNPDSISTFQLVSTINVEGTTWTEYEAFLNGFTGEGSYVAVRALRPASSWYAYVDDFTLDVIPSCMEVRNLEAEATVGAAILRWDASLSDANCMAMVEYKADTATDWIVAGDAEGFSYVLTGLAAGTDYNARVAALCSNGDTSIWQTVDFTTENFGCIYDQQSLINVTVGNGTTTNSYIPSYSVFNYGYSQQFFTASEIGGSGQLTQLTITPANISQQRTYEIYMGQSADSSATSFITPDGLVCVYNGGQIPLVSGQPVTFEFTTPFNYSDTANLVVIFRDLTGSWVSGNTWYGHTAWTDASRYVYSDGSAYAVPPTSEGTTSTFRNNITFFGGTCIGTSTCAAPAAAISYVSTDSVTVMWAPGANETSWDLYVSANDDENYTYVTTTTENSYTFDQLQAGTMYYFRIENPCDPDTMVAEVNTYTECAIVSSAYEDFNSLATGQSADFNPCWSKYYSNGSSYPYVNSINGEKALYFYGYNYGATQYYSWLTGPQMEDSLYNYAVEFDMRRANSGLNYASRIIVGAMSNPADIATFDTIQVVDATMYNQWESMRVSLEDYHGEGSYIALLAPSVPASETSGSAYGYNYVYVDNVYMHEASDCPTPTRFHARNVLSTSAELVWDADSAFTGATVYWSTTNDGSQISDSLEVTDAFAQLTGLTANTTYYCWLTASCELGNTHSRTCTFTTGNTCNSIENLTVTEATSNMATITWTSNEATPATDYIFEWKVADSTVWTSVATTNTYYQLTGLTQNTTYSVRVTAACSNDSADAVTLSFTTVEPGTIGSNEGTYYLPTYPYYEYSISEQMWTSTELAEYGDTINGIYFNAASAISDRDMQIWVVDTTLADLSTSVYVPSTAMTLVMDSTIDIVAGWNLFPFDNPYVRDNAKNLVVLVYDQTGDYESFSGFYATTSSVNSLYAYQDGTSYSTTNLSSLTAAGVRAMMRLDATLLTPTCLAPHPVITSASDNSISLSWIAGMSETSWSVDYRALTDTAWTSVAATTTQTSVTVNNLQPSTSYLFRVGALCSATTSYATVRGTTSCGTFTIPYAEDFNVYSSGEYDFDPCWTKGNAISTSMPYIVNVTDQGPCVLMPVGSYMILPQMGTDLSTLQLRMQYIVANTDIYAYVGVCSSLDDIESITIIDTIYATASGMGCWVTVPFDTYNGTDGYIAIYSPFNQSYYDNVNVELIPQCGSVDSIQLTAVTTNTADLSWNAGNNGASYIVEYGPVGGSTPASVVTSNTSIQFTALQHSTDYLVNIYTVCPTMNDTSYAVEFRFTTECAPIDTLPYIEDFEHSNAPAVTLTGILPNCWAVAPLATSTSYTVASALPQIYIGNAASGTHSMRMYGESIVLLPEMPTSVDSLMISFTDYTTSTYYGLILGVCDSNTEGFEASWTPIDTFTVASSGSHQHMTFKLASYTGSGRYIGFQNYYTTSSTTQYSYHYIDDITVDYLPSCLPVTDLHSTANTATSVTLAWTDLGSASDWEIAYSTSPLTDPATGTLTTVNTNPATINGLNGGTSYYFYVRAICGVDDTSMWSAAFQATPGSWNMRANQTDTINMCGGVIYDDGGANGAYSISQDSYVIVRPDTPGALISVSGTSYTESSFDYVRIYDGEGTAGTELWNDYGVSSNQTFGPFVSSSGPITIYFHSDGSVTYSGYEINVNCLIDDCPVSDLMLDTNVAPSSTALALTWTGSSQTYDVVYGPTGFDVDTAGTALSASTNSIVIGGLTAVTTYDVYVRGLCNSGDTGMWHKITLQTPLCDNVVIAENWDSTMNATTSSYSPIGYSTYNYSYVQTIIDSAYLAEIEDDITAMAFQPASTSAGTHFTHITVYLANVSESDLTSGFIMPDDTAHVFVPVISDRDMCYSDTEWQLHGFDTTFTWDGHSNILVAVNRQHGTWTSGSSFKAHGASASKMRYVYNDNSAYDPTTVSGGTASSTVGDIRLFSCGAACSKPNGIVATNVDYANATLQWNSTATDFEYAVKAVADATWPVETAVTATTVTLSGLQPETAYQFRVRALCDATEGLISDWALYTFTTDSLPCFAPSNLALTGNAYTAATFDWTPGTTETMWNVHIWNSSKDTIVEVTAHPATIGGLAMNTQYNAAVSALCGNGAAESDYSETITFTTLNCEPVTNLRVENVTSNSAVVKWNGNAASYDLEYGMAGFQTGTGTRIEGITGTSYTLTGLEDDYHYDVTVMAHCDATTTSSWSDAVDFTTEPVGIATVDGAQVSLYPNPATATTTVTLAGVSGEVTITVVDLNGRTVMSETMSCEGGCTKTLEVSKLLQGAYFVRLSGENVNAVKKLVVK